MFILINFIEVSILSWEVTSTLQTVLPLIGTNRYQNDIPTNKAAFFIVDRNFRGFIQARPSWSTNRASIEIRRALTAGGAFSPDLSPLLTVGSLHPPFSPVPNKTSTSSHKTDSERLWIGEATCTRRKAIMSGRPVVYFAEPAAESPSVPFFSPPHRVREDSVKRKG